MTYNINEGNRIPSLLHKHYFRVRGEGQIHKDTARAEAMPRAGMSSARAESKDGAAPPPERKRKDAKRRKSKRRAHKVLDAPKTNFIGFETSFELGTFSVVWQRILDSLMREGYVSE